MWYILNIIFNLYACILSLFTKRKKRRKRLYLIKKFIRLSISVMKPFHKYVNRKSIMSPRWKGIIIKRSTTTKGKLKFFIFVFYNLVYYLFYTHTYKVYTVLLWYMYIKIVRRNGLAVNKICVRYKTRPRAFYCCSPRLWTRRLILLPAKSYLVGPPFYFALEIR